MLDNLVFIICYELQILKCIVKYLCNILWHMNSDVCLFWRKMNQAFKIEILHNDVLILFRLKMKQAFTVEILHISLWFSCLSFWLQAYMSSSVVKAASGFSVEDLDQWRYNLVTIQFDRMITITLLSLFTILVCKAEGPCTLP